jgi:NADPH:quinone reductase-like Zn-dependent oxidoreductase
MLRRKQGVAGVTAGRSLRQERPPPTTTRCGCGISPRRQVADQALPTPDDWRRTPAPSRYQTKGEDLAILAGLVADGRLRPRIGLELDWRKTAQAFAALTRREVRGKAVMTIR